MQVLFSIRIMVIDSAWYILYNPTKNRADWYVCLFRSEDDTELGNVP